MKKANLTRTLLAAVSIVALTSVMYGCMHDSDDPPPITNPGDGDGDGDVDVDLSGLSKMPGYSSDAMAEAGTHTIAAGMSMDVGDISFMCAAGGEDCVVTVTVADDGMVSATSTGGMVTAMNSAAFNTRLATEAAALAMDITPLALRVNTDGMDPDSMGMPETADRLTMSDKMIATIDGWTGAAYERMNPAVGLGRASTDMMVVYNNRGGNQSVIYSTHYAVADNQSPVGASGFTAATGVMEFSNLGTASSLLNLSGLGNQTAFDNNNDATDGVATSFTGMFHGLAGTFACTAASCTINELLAGGYTTTGTWSFTPSPFVQATTTVSIPDPDFMHFGFWINASDTASGDPVYDARAFYGGSQDSDMSAVRALAAGTATYAGSATGLYVLDTFGSDGAASANSSGQFTADANLTAVFGTPSTQPSDYHNAVHGTITNFMRNGEAIPGGWSLDLMPLAWGNTGDGPFRVENFSTTGRNTRPTGSTAAATGQWEYDFYGAVSSADATPTGIAGEFSGMFTNGEVIGAFGAERVPPSN